jgi:dGTPase
MTMNWTALLLDERFEPLGAGTDPRKPTKDSGTVYEEDIGRILNNAAFRRLQGKTQVYPLPAIDYYRTRLTHTIEVAHIAHVLGDLIGRHVLRHHPELAAKDVSRADFSDIAAGAAYAHDLGNPPFGHIGEYAIQSWFEVKKADPTFAARSATTLAYNDFLYFDGNAQGFRILTRLQGWRDKGGFQCSYALLGAYSKYPFSSGYASQDYAKFGFMHEDAAYAELIFGNKLELPLLDSSKGKKYARHPLSFVTEAADDICYLTSDLQDGVRAGLVEFKDLEPLFLSIAGQAGMSRRYPMLYSESPEQKLAFLRLTAVSSLIRDAAFAFASSYDAIMSGSFHSSLLESGKLTDSCAEMRKICRERIYIERSKIETEGAGYKIIQTFLSMFDEMVCHIVEKGADFGINKKLENLFHLMPREFRVRLRKGQPYQCYLAVVDYVSGMSDRYALELYQKLQGSSVVLGRMM